MSTNRTNSGIVECNGDRMPCREFIDETGAWAREVRKVARAAGWLVNVKNPWGHSRLDYCPKHRGARP